MNQQRFISALRELLPLSDGELEQIISYARRLDNAEAVQHLENLLGNSPKSVDFISFFLDTRTSLSNNQDIDGSKPAIDDSNSKILDHESESHPPPYVETSVTQNGRRFNQHATARHTNDIIEAGKIRARDEV
jgi:hypothetical protein